MSIFIAAPPPTAEDALRRGMRALIRVSGSAHRELAERTNAERLAFSLPHPVYTIGLGDLLLDRPFAPTLSGWRYIILRGQEVIGKADLRYNSSEEAVEFACWSTSQMAKDMVHIVTVAENLPQISESDYELRVLSAPGLYLLALWLRGETDIVIPLPPATRHLTAYEVYSIDELRSRVHQTAADRLMSDKDLFNE